MDFFASFFFKKFIWHFSRVFVIYHAKNIIVRYSFNFWFKKLFLTKLLSRISRQTWTSSFTWNIDLKEEKSCNKTVSESFKTLFHLAVMSNNILRSNLIELFRAKKRSENNIEKVISRDIELQVEMVIFRYFYPFFYQLIWLKKRIWKNVFVELSTFTANEHKHVKYENKKSLTQGDV